MNPYLNATHDSQLRSWVPSANVPGCDFPIQNLPFGCFSVGDEKPRVGVAIGDQILDLRKSGLNEAEDMNALMGATAEERSHLRALLSSGLAQGSKFESAWQSALISQSDVVMHMPCRIGDYTDFYTSVHHATTVGRQFRPENPLLPNYKWVPIGYHGRASSIGLSGQRFKRPKGQTKAADVDSPSLGPSKRLDYELELGWFVGQGNPQGESIEMGEAENHLFGVSLFNDWSARDIQGWEYQPLGPFLSKNFASTVAPWLVTMEALAPFRAAFERPAQDPQPLPYLDSSANRTHGAFSIHLEVLIQTAVMREAGVPATRLSLTNSSRAAYWTPAQLIAHHTINGCNLQPGDLLGSGTLSGPNESEAGSLLELTSGGKKPFVLPNGEKRGFLEDGDTLIMRGWCERDGAVRIGLGEVSGTVLPA